MTAVSGTEIRLSWTGSTNATQYQIEEQVDGSADWTVIGTVNDPQTSFGATGLTADGTSYSFRICAVNTAGKSAYSNVPAAQTQNWVPTVAAGPFAGDDPVTTTSTTLSVLGTDDGGESNLTYTWSVVYAPSGGDAYFDDTNGTNAAAGQATGEPLAVAAWGKRAGT